MKGLLRNLAWVVVLVVVAGLLVYAFLPTPVEVDAVTLERGAMRVTVDEEGRTRLRERYIVSSPVAGRQHRIAHKAGDVVEAHVTVLAVIEPAPPALLDARSRREAEARVQAAEAALQQVEPTIQRTTHELRRAQLEFQRVSRLAERQAAAQDEVDRAALQVAALEAELDRMALARQIAESRLAEAQAALADASPGRAGHTIELTSPITGTVMRVEQESDRVVSPGQPLIEVGDPKDLEVVIDLLSRDAVQVRPGAAVVLERWGGGDSLRGSVRRVEPSGFMRVSALGVEEQRVNVIVDLVDPAEARPALGDGFRVDARIVVWEAADVLTVPTGALLRDREQWSVFRIEDGRARLQPVRIGHMNGTDAHVLEGLEAGQRVILHPGDRVSDGVSVTVR